MRKPKKTFAIKETVRNRKRNIYMDDIGSYSLNVTNTNTKTNN